MTASAQLFIDRDSEAFSHDAARQLRHTVTTTAQGNVVIDFGQVRHISTAALAELVLLRRKLLSDGCDLRVVNMTGQVAALYRICRLEGVLPSVA